MFLVSPFLLLGFSPLLLLHMYVCMYVCVVCVCVCVRVGCGKGNDVDVCMYVFIGRVMKDCSLQDGGAVELHCRRTGGCERLVFPSDKSVAVMGWYSESLKSCWVCDQDTCEPYR